MPRTAISVLPSDAAADDFTANRCHDFRYFMAAGACGGPARILLIGRRAVALTRPISRGD